MDLYMISYDIAERDRDEYQPLWAYIRSIHGRKVLYSQWIVVHRGPAEELLTELASKVKLKRQDGIVVQRVTQDTAAVGKLEMEHLAFATLVSSSG